MQGEGGGGAGLGVEGSTHLLHGGFQREGEEGSKEGEKGDGRAGKGGKTLG